jgi:hypothetical protein
MTLFPELTESKPVHLKCRGHVERTDVLAEPQVGIAASIDSYEFFRLRYLALGKAWTL